MDLAKITILDKVRNTIDREKHRKDIGGLLDNQLKIQSIFRPNESSGKVYTLFINPLQKNIFQGRDCGLKVGRQNIYQTHAKKKDLCVSERKGSLLVKNGNKTERNCFKDEHQPTIKRANTNNSIRKKDESQQSSPQINPLKSQQKDQKYFLATGSMFGIRSSINWKKKQMEIQSGKNKAGTANEESARNKKLYLKQKGNANDNFNNEIPQGNSPKSPLKLEPKFTNEMFLNSKSQVLSRRQCNTENPQKNICNQICSHKSQQTSKIKDPPIDSGVPLSKQRAVSQNPKRSPRSIEDKANIAKAKGKGKFSAQKYKVNFINFFDLNHADPEFKNVYPSCKKMTLSNLQKFYDFCLKTMEKQSKNIVDCEEIEQATRQRYQELIALSQSGKFSDQQNPKSKSQKNFLQETNAKTTEIKSFKRYADRDGAKNRNLKQISQTEQNAVTNGNHLFNARVLKKDWSYAKNNNFARHLSPRKDDYEREIAAWEVNQIQ